MSSPPSPEPMLTCEVDTDVAELVSVVLFEAGALAVGEEQGRHRDVLLRAGFATEDAARHAADQVAHWTAATVALVIPTWQDAQRDGFTPTAVGPWFVTIPDAPVATPSGLLHLQIDPGPAFGHGAHPSTRLLLELLAVRAPFSGPILDVGTGTGVLAIAAASLGADVLAVEVDPLAVSCARENVDRNPTPGSVEVRQLDGGTAEAFEAHELAMVNVTIDQHRRIAPSLSRTPQLLISGLLEHQLNEAVTCYDRQVADTRVDDGWVAALLERPSSG